MKNIASWPVFKLFRSRLSRVILAAAVVLAIGVGAIFVIPAIQGQAATVKSVSKCLGTAAIPLENQCITVKYTVYSSTNEQITSVSECVDVRGPVTSANVLTHLDIYTGGVKVWFGDGPHLVYGRVTTHSNECITFLPKKTVKPGNVGVWTSALGTECTTATQQCIVGGKNPPRPLGPSWIWVSDFK